MKAASGLAKNATAVGDFLGLPIAAKRRTRLLHLRERAIGRVHIRINGAWLYYIDGDAFRSEVACPSSRVGGNRRLGRGVVGDHRAKVSGCQHPSRWR
jgi:hypothetical protein